MRVWVPVFVRTGSIVEYWREPGLHHIAGAAVLTFVVCIIALCSLFILLSQYIMRVHFANRDPFCVGELLIVALRRSTTRSTYRLYRQDRIVSVTFGGSVGIVVDEVQRDPVDVNSIWLQVPEIANGKHHGAESGYRSKHRGAESGYRSKHRQAEPGSWGSCRIAEAAGAKGRAG